MKINEILNWAIGSNRSKALIPQKQNNNLIVWFKFKEVLPLIDPNFRVTPDSIENHIGKRMDRAELHFKNGNFMDPPELVFVKHSKQFPIGINDGRHRIAAASKLGEEWFPAIVSKEDYEQLQKIISSKINN